MKIGDRVSVQVSFYDPKGSKKPQRDTGGMKTVSARFTYINQAHRYFLAKYKVPGGILRECFKF